MIFCSFEWLYLVKYWLDQTFVLKCWCAFSVYSVECMWSPVDNPVIHRLTPSPPQF